MIDINSEINLNDLDFRDFKAHNVVATYYVQCHLNDLQTLMSSQQLINPVWNSWGPNAAG